MDAPSDRLAGAGRSSQNGRSTKNGRSSENGRSREDGLLPTPAARSKSVPRIEILQPSNGAGQARGLAVIIDVFRAFSLVPYLFDRGAARIIAAGQVEQAFRLRDEHPDSVLVGERHALKIPGFDHSNSPFEILTADLTGRTVIHTTHAGTRALVAARAADAVITGSFVNAGAVVRYILEASPAEVSLVCSGFEGRRQTLEDTLCAGYLRDLLEGRRPDPDFDTIRGRIISSECSRRFLDPAERTCPERDAALCLDLDRFDMVARRAERHEGWCLLQAVKR
jgi:2-phosphosulfolactate phosphatase